MNDTLLLPTWFFVIVVWTVITILGLLLYCLVCFSLYLHRVVFGNGNCAPIATVQSVTTTTSTPEPGPWFSETRTEIAPTPAAPKPSKAPSKPSKTPALKAAPCVTEKGLICCGHLIVSPIRVNVDEFERKSTVYQCPRCKGTFEVS